MSSHAHRSVDTNSPALDAAQAMIVVALFGISVLLGLYYFAGLPLLGASNDGHGAAPHAAAAPAEH